MTVAHWLPFAIASAVLVAIPGPTVLLVVSYALGHGRRYALATTAGVALGDLTAMTASMLGLGVILAVSAGWFTVLKWAGAAYLVFLGLRALLKRDHDLDLPAQFKQDDPAAAFPPSSRHVTIPASARAPQIGERHEILRARLRSLSAARPRRRGFGATYGSRRLHLVRFVR